MSDHISPPDTHQPLDWRGVLEALPSRVAVVDSQADLCYCNTAWDGLLDPGAPFLVQYQQAFGLSDVDNIALTTGVQAVLSGAQERFDLNHIASGATGDLSVTLTLIPYQLLGEQGVLVTQHTLAHYIQSNELFSREREFLHALLDSMPEQIYFKDLNGQYTLVNRVQAQALGLDDPQAVLGKTDYDFYVTAICDDARRDEQRIIESGQPMIDKTEGQTLFDDATGKSSEVWVSTTKAPILSVDGAVIGIVGITRNITERVRTEDALRRALQQSQEQSDLIRAQATTLDELSTPLIPITDDVMILPLIGAIDSRRAQQVIETMLTGVSQHHARVIVLDITGVLVVDTHVAGTLLRAAQAVGLLGSRLVLTGIRPEVAQTLVGLGADLGSITTYGSLQSGIAGVLRGR